MRDAGDEPDEHVFQRISKRSKESNIDDAIKVWLARTPIYGSLPGDPADDVLVDRFVSNYLKVRAWGSSSSSSSRRRRDERQ